MNFDPAILPGFRPRMMSVACRTLGGVTGAEGAVRDAFVRLQAAEDVRPPGGFLISTTPRLCIGRQRAARRRKEDVGPWVPEPVETRDGARGSALAGSLTQAFLLVLERLSPDERAAFLLRTVFDCEYAATVNGEPGVVVTSGGAVIDVVSLRTEGGEVRAVYMTHDPDRLSRWSVARVEERARCGPPGEEIQHEDRGDRR
ncbi:MAG TPA: hypothetical protein VIL46_08840 [Gemmataceae bacterium]